MLEKTIIRESPLFDTRLPATRGVTVLMELLSLWQTSAEQLEK